MIAFTIEGAPRTKKTHNRLLIHQRKVLPSKQYEEWFNRVLGPCRHAANKAASASGLPLPMTGELWVAAHFYLDATTRGDLTGYMQALADLLQMPRFRPARNGAGVIEDDSQIRSWDGTRLLFGHDTPHIYVTIAPFTDRL